MTWPRDFHPVVDGAPDLERTVAAYPLAPGGAAALAAWSGGQVFAVNGAPAVLLPGGGDLAGRVVGLGDVAVDAGDGAAAEPGGGFGARYLPVEADGPPPAGDPAPPGDEA